MIRSQLLAFSTLAVLSAGCATTSPVGEIRYRNQPIVWRVNDRNDVPRKPEPRSFYRALYYVDAFFAESIERAMEFPVPRRAANVNALDEVPDSTWFTNRIGRKDLLPEEIRRGPAADGPEQHKPWTVIRSKRGGSTSGFWIADRRGYEYLIKLDDPEAPEMQSATDAIVQRILWACGYNTPSDSVVTFRRSELQLSNRAVVVDQLDRKRKMTSADIDAQLARGYVGSGGVYRGLASRRLPGVPIGPISATGVRKDDPNDRIPHERRRELRGLRAIYAWLNQADNQEENTIDSWISDPATQRHYVRHYLLDFGKAFGVLAVTGNRRQWIGFYHYLDIDLIAGSLLTLGLWKRPFEDVTDSGLRGIGAYEIESYDPGRWKGASVYRPMELADRFDSFWASKILIRFTRAQLEAAVAAGRLSDPRSARYLVDTLVARQRMTAQYWFARVAPVDRFEVRNTADGNALCFEDLTLRHRLVPAKVATTFRARAYRASGAPTGWTWSAQPGRDGSACAVGFDKGRLGRDGYVIVRVEIIRDRTALPPALVHIANAPDGRPRVIGVRRK